MLAICGLVIVGALASPVGANAALNVNSMAALGDSLTVAQGAPAGSSWSTGFKEEVNSHHLRLNARSPVSTPSNFAAPGTKMVELLGQAQMAVNAGAQYVTVLMGTNDVCGPLTSVVNFRNQFAAAITTLSNGPALRIFVASIPNWDRLYDVFGGNQSVKDKWASDMRCPNFLVSPSAEARQRLLDFNAALAQLCAQRPKCTFDGNAVYNYQFQAGDYSTSDYFHYSAQGQRALADVTFPIADAGVTPQPPPPPAPTPAPTPPPPPPPPLAVKLPAKLTIDRASITGGRLDSLLTITGAATGSVKVEYLAGGRRSVFTVGVGPARQGAKHVKILRALVGGQRRVRTGILTVRYAGNDAVQSETLRSRAANVSSSLRRTQLSFSGARLVVRGTIKRNINGLVRLRVTYTGLNGAPFIWIQNVRISGGRWATDLQLPVEAAVDPNAYLGMQFTGSTTARGGPYRGEQLGKGLGNLPKS